MELKVRVVRKSPHELPAYQTEGSSGLDLRACLETAVTLKPLERCLVPTGIFMSIPEGYEAQVRPRSGLAIKKGLTVLNAPGTIDSDYRGEIKVALINLSPEEQVIEDGERVAQLVFSNYEKITWQPVGHLDDTQRGEGGFGHSGAH